jgi:hypothetical protein
MAVMLPAAAGRRIMMAFDEMFIDRRAWAAMKMLCRGCSFDLERDFRVGEPQRLSRAP